MTLNPKPELPAHSPTGNCQQIVLCPDGAMRFTQTYGAPVTSRVRLDQPCRASTGNKQVKAFLRL